MRRTTLPYLLALASLGRCAPTIGHPEAKPTAALIAFRAIVGNVALSSIPASEPTLANATYEVKFGASTPEYCSSHHCDKNMDNIDYDHTIYPNACCIEPCATADEATPHFLYMHVEKTGGSSIECAWQEANDAGIVDLMGHSPLATTTACASRCDEAGVPTRLMMTVRNPYDYWQSVYSYAWQCLDRIVCNGQESLMVLDDPAANVTFPAPDGMPVEEAEGVMRSFDAFMHYVAASVASRGVWASSTQTHRVQAKCGEPCEYDELLHTETLTEDWAALLQRYPGLPQVALPVLVESGAGEDHPWGNCPDTEYTPRLRAIVEHLDGYIFDRFDYARSSTTHAP